MNTIKTMKTTDTTTARSRFECRREIREIIIHCSATPEGRDVDAAEIRRWHVRDRGFADIGYHFVVRLDGRVEPGRRLDAAGAHCKGHNAHSIGVCYVGGLNLNFKPCDTRTPAQRGALKGLIDSLRRSFPQAKVYGHNDFARKACPCFDAKKEYGDASPD